MDEETKFKVLYEGGSLRKICDGQNHTAQLLQEDKTWGDDHDIVPCDCPKEEAA